MRDLSISRTHTHMKTIERIPTTKAAHKSAQELTDAVTITLPPILRQMVDEVTEAAGRSFEDFQAEYADMIVSHLLEVAHKPWAVPVDDMSGLDERIDAVLLDAAQDVALSYRKRLPAPR